LKAKRKAEGDISLEVASSISEIKSNDYAGPDRYRLENQKGSS
jgi:hypothetical protein